MGKSTYASALDDIQAALRPFLKGCGFKVRGRTFNRPTEDGLTQVVSLQMGASDPPGTTSILGFRENCTVCSPSIWVSIFPRSRGATGAAKPSPGFRNISAACAPEWARPRAGRALRSDLRMCVAGHRLASASGRRSSITADAGRSTDEWDKEAIENVAA